MRNHDYRKTELFDKDDPNAETLRGLVASLEEIMIVYV
jgi:hypothetical protein